MKIFTKIVVILMMLCTGVSNLYAVSSSKHAPKSVSETQVKKIAKKEIHRLILAKAIDKSWLIQGISNVEKKKFNGVLEWVVSFNNKQIQDSKKQNLYIFINLNGLLLGSNYTGE